jgi:hypothetical protein
LPRERGSAGLLFRELIDVSFRASECADGDRALGVLDCDGVNRHPYLMEGKGVAASALV